MAPNPNPFFKPGAQSDDSEIPALISDEDWPQYIARMSILAYDLPILLVSCDGSYVLKKNRPWGVGTQLCSEWHSAAASTSSYDLQKGERYANFDYAYTKITETGELELSYDYSCQLAEPLRAKL
ncbi:hypothetical protein B0H16DRAFT_1481574 [Mycena metata]|uniref:Uncharacterized protein n=1 Tax=Mycena metata TaxID=1033252 RepID=A0AAD7MA16_9AGAR|nr:hypothetical protein B0H16DRAFT_1481574 [Mycena metata]